MVEDRFPGDERPRKDAIGWWIRLDSAPLSPKERAEFADWLARDPANRAAFEDICRLWGDLEFVRPLVAAPAPAARGMTRTKMPCAAALVAAAFALFFFSDDIWLLLRAEARTGTAERRTIALADGSKIELGPRSAIATNFGDGKREVALLAGEAWFDVAPDADRPFSVSVGGGAVTALGTAFNISTDRTRTEITVVEHRVRVASDGPAVIVGEGEQSAFSPGIPAVAPYPVKLDHVTAWRRGKLIFDDKPLSEVVAVLGHYHSGYILIVDSTIRGRRVSGVFDADQPLAAIQAIEKALGLRAYHFGYLVALTG
jgi:transmembrane sensor